MLAQELGVDARPVVEAGEVRLGGELQEVVVAGQVEARTSGDGSRSAAWASLAARLAHVRLHPEDGLEAGLLEGLVEVDGAEQVAVIGDRHRRHAELRTRSTQHRQRWSRRPAGSTGCEGEGERSRRASESDSTLTKDDRNSQHDDCAPRRFPVRAHVRCGAARTAERSAPPPPSPVGPDAAWFNSKFRQRKWLHIGCNYVRLLQ